MKWLMGPPFFLQRPTLGFRHFLHCSRISRNKYIFMTFIPSCHLCLDSENFKEFKLVKKTQISHNVAKFKFALPTPTSVLGLPIGQHISCRGKDSQGEEVINPYTPTTLDSDVGYFELVIKMYPQGRMSHHFREMKESDYMAVKGPKGRFKYQPGQVRAFGMLAGGSGITPMFQRRKKQKNFEDEELLGIDARPYTYTYGELKAATGDFNPANKLGEGGFGPVYKGTLEDGRLVAVKSLSVTSQHGKSQFMAEIATISAVQHRNLVKLYGCCIEGVKRLLVYEYLENKSLDQLLFGIGHSNLYLDWPTRYDICLGVARGLAYLHEESRVRIVHRDVKASNILLDSDLTPKISDFGLAKLYDDKKTHISTKVAGTRGYLAPEYAMLGHLTEKADIFSFGVVVLELISGRPNSDLNLEDDKIYLLE